MTRYPAPHRVRSGPAVPDAMAITEALRQSSPLADLRRRMHDSQARLDLVRSVLPLLLRPHVSAGPLDAEGWSLLAANAAVAAKLRHLQPRIDALLRQHGWPGVEVRIKVIQDARRPA